MQTTFNTWLTNRQIGDLHPIMRAPVTALLSNLSMSGHRFALFEGYRTPERQEALYAQGRTKPGAVVTHARSWESAHNFGLAVDLVWFENGQWSWDAKHPWDKLGDFAERYGLVQPIRWDRPHIEHPAYAEMKGRR